MNAPHQCCTDDSSTHGKRNRYFLGKRLTPAALQTEQEYGLHRRRMLNRALHGWGVVHGFALSCRGDGERVMVSPGLAIDQCGRELVLVEPDSLKVNQLIVFNEDGKLIAAEMVLDWLKSKVGHELLLAAHYAETTVGQVPVSNDCGCTQHEWEYTCESIRYSIRPIHADIETSGCELKCDDCDQHDCCDDMEHHGERGGCECVCNHLNELQFENDCGRLKKIEESCRPVSVDLKLEHSIPLGKLKIKLTGDDQCPKLSAEIVDQCKTRRFVKRNDLLFDLIRGCDLTRIVDFGWKDWLETPDQIPLDKFRESFATPSNDESISKIFWVQFSRPICEQSLRPEVFRITVLFEGTEGWWESFRVPVWRLEYRKDDRRAYVVVPQLWLEDAVAKRHTRFDNYSARVEVEVHGDLIVDCHGQAVDASAVGIQPRGNGTPGGTFFSSFQVEKA